MARPVLESLRETFADDAEASIAHGVVVLAVAPERVLQIARRLAADHRFDVLLDVTAIDWPGRSPRFEVVWHFYSTTHLVRVRMRGTSGCSSCPVGCDSSWATTTSS